LREGSFSSEDIDKELARIREDVDEYRASGTSWLSLFRERNLFNRLWRAALLQFMAQICGATTMKYYLTVLMEQVGVEKRTALMAGGIESTLKIGMTVIEMYLIDRIGRRVTLVAGCIGMGAGMLVSYVSLLHLA
jgi:MFS family permease